MSVRGIDTLGLFGCRRGFGARHSRRGGATPRYGDGAVAARCREGFVRTREHAGGRATAGYRVLRTRLSRWRYSIAGRWAELASHAPVTQPGLGSPSPDRLSRTVGPETA